MTAGLPRSEPTPAPAPPAGASAKIAPPPAALPSSNPPSSGRRGEWVVQVHALKDRAAAGAIARRLTGKGYPAFVLDPPAGAPAIADRCVRAPPGSDPAVRIRSLGSDPDCVDSHSVRARPHDRRSLLRRDALLAGPDDDDVWRACDAGCGAGGRDARRVPVAFSGDVRLDSITPVSRTRHARAAACAVRVGRNRHGTHLPL